MAAAENGTNGDMLQAQGFGAEQQGPDENGLVSKMRTFKAV